MDRIELNLLSILVDAAFAASSIHQYHKCVRMVKGRLGDTHWSPTFKAVVKELLVVAKNLQKYKTVAKRVALIDSGVLEINSLELKETLRWASANFKSQRKRGELRRS